MDVSPRTFQAIHTINIAELQSLSNEEIRPLLPCLSRIAFRYGFEVSLAAEEERNAILEIIKKHEDINSIISLLSYDFQAMEQDLRKELEQRLVYRTNLNDLKASINENAIISLDFSRNENFCRHRLIINELLQMQQLTMLISTAQLKESFYKSELFELDVYINEISDVICCAMYELPNTLRLCDIVEALLYVRMGPRIICRIAANFSDHFEEICLKLLNNSKQTDNEESLISKIRTSVLRNLCRMNPLCVPLVRSAAIEMGKMPALCLQLSLDHMEIFHDNEQNKSARYLNDLVQFVRNILLSNENEAKSWLKDGQKQVELLEEKILNHSDQNKNEMLHEPVYTLACQVYNRINDLFDLSDDRIESNKELLLMFAHVFTWFNSTLSEKFKFQHEMEDYKDRYKQQKFLNTRERENVNRLKEKLEEYEAQNHEDSERFESEISLLESKIKNVEKEKRKLEYEIEDNLKEMKHTHDSIANLLNLIEQYGSSDEYGIAQFFEVFHKFVNTVDLTQSADKTKVINQLNNCLDKKLVDVKNEALRMQGEKILVKFRHSEDRINKIFENGANNFRKNDFIFEPMNLHKIESTNHNLREDFCDEQSCEYEDDLTEQIKHMKKMNQANIDRMKCAQQIASTQIANDLESTREEIANETLNDLIDEHIQEEIKDIHKKLKEENKAKLTDILNAGLVKVNSNNEIVASKSNSNLSQAKLMLISENNSANEEHITSYQEDSYNRFEKSLAEIITHSVNQSELSSPEEGETLQSILDSKHNSLNDNVNDRHTNNERVINEINVNKNDLNHIVHQAEKSVANTLSPEETSKIDCKIIEILEQISKYNDFNDIIDKEKLMKKSVCSPKHQMKSSPQSTPEKRPLTNGTIKLEMKDMFTNTDLIEINSTDDSTLINSLNNTKSVSISAKSIETRDIEVNTDTKELRIVSVCTVQPKTRSVSCSTRDFTSEFGAECKLISYQDSSISTHSNLNYKKSIGTDCLTPMNDKSNMNCNSLSSSSTQTKTFYKILIRSSKLLKLRKGFRKMKPIKNKSPKNNSIIQQNGVCDHSEPIYQNNNYLNGNKIDHHQKSNGKHQSNIETSNLSLTNHTNHQSTKVDYNFVFCHHVPPVVNFLATFFLFLVGLIFRMVKNFILLFVFVFFLLQIVFYIWPPPKYLGLSWQDILLSFLEPHITVHHYNAKV